MLHFSIRFLSFEDIKLDMVDMVKKRKEMLGSCGRIQFDFNLG